MNLKVFSIPLIVLVCCGSLIAAHGHSHDEDHSHEEDVKPSFKYSRQANEQTKQQVNHASHNHHGHSHGEEEAHHDHHHGENLKTKDVSG